MSKKEDARIIQSRGSIEDAGIQVLLRNPDAGMSEIALAAGVGRATLYRHFPSKRDLVLALAKKCLEETDQVVAPIKAAHMRGSAAIKATIQAVLPLTDRYRFLTTLWIYDPEDAELNTMYVRQLEEFSTVVQQAQDEGAIDPELPISWVVSCFDGLLNAAWQYVQWRQSDAQTAVDLMTRSFFASCSK